MTSQAYSINDLLRVMERLRDPHSGCPWDIAQDFQSIVPSTLEECYELAEAIEHEDFPHVGEELGDLLFQVVFYAQLGREADFFDFEGIVGTLVEKLLRRHPHVFLDGDIEGVVSTSSSVEAVRDSWESIKRRERENKRLTGILADVPRALPALPRAQKLQKRAATVGFDWSDVNAVLGQLEAEIAELRGAMAAADGEAINAEVGDVLFSAVNVARHLDVDAEASLRASSSRFEQRFRLMETLAGERGETLEALGAEQLEALWRQAKLRLE